MEWIDIVDENNQLTGQVEDRWVAYDKGLWKRTVSCWIMNEKGEVLLQKRTANKKLNPNKWAKTGGQIDSGETPEEAIIREVEEEIGIRIPKEQIKVVDIFKKNNKNPQFAYQFVFVVNYKIEEYKLQKEEVSEVKYTTIEDIEMAKKNNDANYTFCNWSDDDFFKEMQILKNKRKEILKVTDNILIRKAKYEDIEQIVDINIEDWKKVYRGIIDDVILDNLNRKEKIEKWKKHYNLENVIVVEQDEEILGYCRYDDNAVYQNTDIDSEIMAIYVRYNKIACGIGEKLVKYVMNDLKNKNKSKMVIWCLQKNENARRFYEKMGGKLLQEEKYLIKDGKRYKEVGYVYDIK